MLREQEDRYSLARAVLAHRRAVGFEHLGVCQQDVFLRGNGLHDFVSNEPCESVALRTSEALSCEWPPARQANR